VSSAAPAYRFSAEPYRRHSSAPYPKTRSKKTRVHAIPGAKPYSPLAPSREAAPLWKTVALMLAGIILVLGVLGFARIFLTHQTVEVLHESAALSTQISEARTQGTVLEVNQSSLVNTANVLQKATALGMSEPEYVSTIVLPQDVVATDAEGNLSLGKSVLRSQGVA